MSIQQFPPEVVSLMKRVLALDEEDRAAVLTLLGQLLDLTDRAAERQADERVTA